MLTIGFGNARTLILNTEQDSITIVLHLELHPAVGSELLGIIEQFVQYLHQIILMRQYSQAVIDQGLHLQVGHVRQTFVEDFLSLGDNTYTCDVVVELYGLPTIDSRRGHEHIHDTGDGRGIML